MLTPRRRRSRQQLAEDRPRSHAGGSAATTPIRADDRARWASGRRYASRDIHFRRRRISSIYLLTSCDDLFHDCYYITLSAIRLLVPRRRSASGLTLSPRVDKCALASSAFRRTLRADAVYSAASQRDDADYRAPARQLFLTSHCRHMPPPCYSTKDSNYFSPTIRYLLPFQNFTHVSVPTHLLSSAR